MATPKSRERDMPLSSLTKAAGLSSVYELLLFSPSGYIDFTKVLTMARSFPLGKRAVIEVKVKQPLDKSPAHIEPVESRFSDKRMRRPAHQMIVGDEQRSIWLYFGKRITKGGFVDLAEGDVFYVAGLLEMKDGDYFIFNPEFAPDRWLGRIMPVYPHLKSLQDRRRLLLHKDQVREEVEKLLKTDLASDRLSALVEKRLGERPLPKSFIKQLTRALHHPPSITEIAEIKGWIDDLGIRALLAEDKTPCVDNPRSALAIPPSIVDDVLSAIPFKLSDSQRIAINDTLADLATSRPSRRLISGDVGSGKSIIQFACAAAAQLSGYQVAIMTPNGQLSRQLFRVFQSFYPRVPAHYLGAGSGRHQIDLEKKPILIGTTSVMHFVARSGIELDLAMLDEQQKAGQEQKDALLAPHTNFIELTATPIPKSMALLLFANTAVSQIYQHCNKDIRTFIVNTSHRKQMFAALNDVILKGGKACVVYTKIEEDIEEEGDDNFDQDDRQPRKALEGAFDQWNARFPGKVSVLHGRMKEKDKIAALEQFENGGPGILLTTTVIEIGIDIKGLQLMVINNPEVFGASQLHQLRGRLVRDGGATGWFFMYVENAIPQRTMKRLVSVRETNDGFALANSDLELRGFGDVIGGPRQHGKTIGLFRNRDINPKSLQPYLESLARTGGFDEALERAQPEFND